MRILYVDIDTLRPDHLGCYGYPRATSTNIDKVTEDSVRFTDVYCSDAPCLPSRAALMTGRFGIHTGCVGHGGVNAEMRWEGRNRGMAKGGDTIAFGDFAIQATERGKCSSAQLEAARVAINRHFKRRGKVWMRVFPQKSVTKKPAETRMGKGKGAVEFWCAVIKPGTILFEASGVPASMAREAMRLADGKLPFKCKFIVREGVEIL